MSETHDHDHDHSHDVAVASPEFSLPPQFLVRGFQQEVERLNADLARLNDNRVYLLGLIAMKDGIIESVSQENVMLKAQLEKLEAKPSSNGRKP